MFKCFDAFRLGIDCAPDWFMGYVNTKNVVLHGLPSGDVNADIKTMTGTQHANFGDYIIRGIIGELHVCSPEIFKMNIR